MAPPRRRNALNLPYQDTRQLPNYAPPLRSDRSNLNFTLRPWPGLVIDAFYNWERYRPLSTWAAGERVGLDIEVRSNGRTIFRRGQLYVGLAPDMTTDGPEARSLVLSAVAMVPGDTDEEYFENYTPAQREWAEANEERLSMIRYDRYGAV